LILPKRIRHDNTRSEWSDACGQSQHYQTKMGSPRDRFGAAVSTELGEDRRDMELAVWGEIPSRRAITLLEAPSAMVASSSCRTAMSGPLRA